MTTPSTEEQIVERLKRRIELAHATLLKQRDSNRTHETHIAHTEGLIHGLELACIDINYTQAPQEPAARKIRPITVGPVCKGGHNDPPVDEHGFVVLGPRPPSPGGSGGKQG